MVTCLMPIRPSMLLKSLDLFIYGVQVHEINMGINDARGDDRGLIGGGLSLAWYGPCPWLGLSRRSSIEAKVSPWSNGKSMTSASRARPYS